MNRENMQKAIAVMKRVATNKDHRFNMSMWQTGDFVNTEQAAIECGTVCCFAGWLAISPEFEGQLSVIDGGIPNSKLGHTGSTAIGEILDIPDISKTLPMCGMTYHDDSCKAFSPTDFYGVKDWSDITPEVIVKKLEQMLLEDTAE